MSDVDPSRTTPLGMVRYALEFYGAAVAVHERFGDDKGYEILAPSPALFLLGRSIELALKAVLQEKRGTFLLTHDLVRLASERTCVHMFEQEEFDHLKLLNELYASKQLEYITIGAKLVPLFGSTEALARMLVYGAMLEIPTAVRLLETPQGRMLQANEYK